VGKAVEERAILHLHRKKLKSEANDPECKSQKKSRTNQIYSILPTGIFRVELYVVGGWDPAALTLGMVTQHCDG